MISFSRTIRDKRGDIPSVLFAVVILLVVGILLVFMNRLTDELYTGFDDYFEGNAKFNDSIARTAIQDIQEVENSAWDYAFLAIALGMILALGLTAFSTRISGVFFWIYAVLALVVVMLSVIMSNAWQKIAENPEMTTTIARFPITDSILGSYYPTLAVVIIAIMMILLFGKRQETFA